MEHVTGKAGSIDPDDDPTGTVGVWVCNYWWKRCPQVQALFHNGVGIWSLPTGLVGMKQ